MNRNKYLIKNTAIFAIGNIGTKLISFFLVPFYTYVLSSKDYGIINTLYSVCAVLIPVATGNVCEAIRRYLLDKEADINSIQTVESIWNLVCGISGIFIYILMKNIQFTNEYALFVAIYIVSYGFSINAFEYLRGSEKLKLYTLCSLLQAVLIAVFNILFLVALNKGINGYFFSYSLSFLVTGVLAYILGGQITSFRFQKIDKSLFIQMSSFSLLLIPNSIMWWVTNASDKIMLTYFSSAMDTGIYSVSAKLPSIISTLSSIMMQAWQFSAIKESESKDNVEYNEIMFKVYVGIVVIISSFLIMINRPFMKIYVSHEYYESALYSPILICCSAVATLSTFIGTSYYVKKDMKGNFKSSVVGATVNVVLNFLLIPKFAIYGASIATLVSYIAVLIFRIADTKKYIPIKYNREEGVILCVAIVIMLCFSYINNGWINFWAELIVFAVLLLYYFSIHKDILHRLCDIVSSILQKTKK